MRKIVHAALLGVVLAGVAAGPAAADRWYARDDRRYDDRYDRYDRRYDDRNDRRYGARYNPNDYPGCGAFCKSVGFRELHPVIRRDPQLVNWVRDRFDRNRNGLLDVKEARRANDAFERRYY